MKMIHWHALDSAIKIYPPTYATLIMKILHGWQSIGQQKALMNEDDDICPMCRGNKGKMHYI